MCERVINLIDAIRVRWILFKHTDSYDSMWHNIYKLAALFALFCVTIALIYINYASIIHFKLMSIKDGLVPISIALTIIELFIFALICACIIDIKQRCFKCIEVYNSIDAHARVI
jgi:hypothetical protein